VDAGRLPGRTIAGCGIGGHRVEGERFCPAPPMVAPVLGRGAALDCPRRQRRSVDVGWEFTRIILEQRDADSRLLVHRTHGLFLCGYPRCGEVGF
jgi:hypothetical protein